jgi:hypothetical protein
MATFSLEGLWERPGSFSLSFIFPLRLDGGAAGAVVMIVGAWTRVQNQPAAMLVGIRLRTYLLEEGEAVSNWLPMYCRMLTVEDLKHDEI